MCHQITVTGYLTSVTVSLYSLWYNCMSRRTNGKPSQEFAGSTVDNPAFSDSGAAKANDGGSEAKEEEKIDFSKSETAHQ